MMKKLLLFAFFLCFAATVFSQPPLQWGRNYNGGNNEWFGDMMTDINGNTFTAGLSIDTTTNRGEMVVIKYFTSGDTAWIASFDSLPGLSVGRMNQDAAGNTLVCGSSTSPTGGVVGLVVKFDVNGNYLWHQTIKTQFPYSMNGSYDVKADAAGNVFVAGATADVLDLTISKLTPGGAILWTSMSPLTPFNYEYYSFFTGFDIDASGNTYMAAIFTKQDSVGFGGYNNDYALIKYDAAGNIVWSVTDTVAGADYYAESIGRAVICSGNDVYIMQPLPGYIPACTIIPSKAIVLMRYASNGTQSWRNDYVYPSSIYNFPRTLKKQGNSLIAGGTTYINSITEHDFLAIKCDVAGNLTWMKKFDNDARNDNLWDLCLDQGGNVYATGLSANPSDLFCYSYSISCDNAGNYLWNIKGDTTIYNCASVIQTDLSGAVIIGGALVKPLESDMFTLRYSIAAGIQESSATENEHQLTVFPNPNNGKFMIKSSAADVEITELIIFDVSGREVIHRKCNTSEVAVNAERWKNGYYSFRASLSDKSVQRGRFLKAE